MRAPVTTGLDGHHIGVSVGEKVEAGYLDLKHIARRKKMRGCAAVWQLWRAAPKAMR
jgi:hypothetical protein